MRRFLISLIFVLFVCFAQTTEARKLALLVGVDEYDDVPSLKCCVNDMKTLKEALMKIGFEEDDIQLLVTGGAGRDYPTKKKIERKISEILSEAGPKDLIFLAFSGHGAQEGEKVYFCPPDVEAEDLDGTCVSITRVMDDLALCKAKFKWMVVDACRNDPNQGARGIGGKGLQIVPSPPEGIALFQSCAKGEESWEDSESGNGYFTKNFVAALSGEADTDHDGTLTLMEVCKWTTAQTKAEVKKAENKTQRPYFSGSVSDFTITKDLNVPEAKALAAEARKAMETENYALAIEKFDAALALWHFDYWKRERDWAQKLLEKEKALQEATMPKLQSTRLDSFEWDGTKITKFIGKETEVVIPEGVKEIGASAFQGCTSLTSVIIPKGVTEIGESAFKECISLTSVVIPEGVTAIKDYTFNGCSSLKSVEIPKGVTAIGGLAFYHCISLKSIVIPYGVQVIEGAAFCGCISLTSVEIPNSVTKIEWSAFNECRSLMSVVIPESVRDIGSDVFSDCPALKRWSISSANPYFKSDGTGLLTKDGKKLISCLGSAKEYQIPEGVTEIGSSAFQGCTSLTSVVIPKGVTKIGGGAFNGCIALESVEIPEGVTEIGSAFSGCSSLTSVVIPEGVTGGIGFSGCTSLMSVVIPVGITEGIWFTGCSSLKSIVIPEGVTKIGNEAFKGCISLTSVVIPKTVTEIGERAFEGCSSLKSVEIPEGVTRIGHNGAFKDCKSLTSVVIPKSMKLIGTYAFQGCTSLTSVIIPEGVREIGYWAFNDCTSLESIVIPDSVNKIGYSVFVNCQALKEWSISPNHPYFKSDGPCLFTRDGKKLLACLCSAKEYRIPDGVTEIEAGAFHSCHSLKSVVIPKGMSEIGSWAFQNCSSLTSVVIPSGTEVLRENAFENCRSLISVEIPESVTWFGYDIFKDSPNVTIYAPAGSTAERYAKKEGIPYKNK